MATTYYLPQDVTCSSQQPTDFHVLLMSQTQNTNSGDINQSSLGVPYIGNMNGFADCTHPDDQFQPQFFTPRSSIPFFQDGYSHSMMTMMGHQNICAPSRLPPSPSYHDSQAVSPALIPLSGGGAQFFPSPLPYVSGPYDRSPEPQQESILCRGKRQRDESYRYSLGCISRRVRSWLEKSKPYAGAAQLYLEDQLVRDTAAGDGTDDNLYELFDEPRRKRFCSQFLVDGNHTLASHCDSAASCSGVFAAQNGVMSNPFLFSAPMFSDSLSAASPRGVVGSVSVSEDLHGCNEQDYIVKFPKQIPAICPTVGIKVNFEALTDRAVLRNWRCRTDDGDVIFRRGRRRFFRRVAVLPPDNWQPNKHPQAWEWAPSGPFALHLGEYVSLSGTNGYPYEIVLIRHIPPALRCFLSLIPASPEVAAQMLNGETIAPENPYIVHAPVDSVTHKWILNGFRPRDYTRDLALDYITKDLEMERAQRERKKAHKQPILNVQETPVVDHRFIAVAPLGTPSDDVFIKSESSDFPATALVIGCI